MTVVSLDKDPDRLTLTLTADLDAPVERVWQLWADPRQLERWWGPPTHPATVERHDLTPGGEVTYYMTGPEGEKSRGWWRVGVVEPPARLEFIDGFADPDGTAADLPTNSIEVRLSPHGDGTRMELRAVFDSREHMERLMTMGMAEGLRLSVGQMDALLAT